MDRQRFVMVFPTVLFGLLVAKGIVTNNLLREQE
jgi:hypothetical protein